MRREGGSTEFAESQEMSQPVVYNTLNPDNLTSIADYYRFEIEQGFSSVPPQSKFEKMVELRQKQIKEGKIEVVVAKEENQTIGSAVVVLENGTMGKKIKPNEAWAAGIVVADEKRGQGIGKALVVKQEELARQAGKDTMMTTIAQDNYPSMKLYFGSGYQLNGVDQRPDEVCYFYAKDLESNNYQNQNLLKEIQAAEIPELSGPITQETPNQILIRVNDKEKIQAAIDSNYRGVSLVASKKTQPEQTASQDFIVFVR